MNNEYRKTLTTLTRYIKWVVIWMKEQWDYPQKVRTLPSGDLISVFEA